MPETLLVPSIEHRISSLVEVNRRRERERDSRGGARRPTITLSREFGCEAYPMAEQLQTLLENKTGETWLLMDKGILDEVARNHHLAEQVMHGLGETSHFIDEILATFSSRWKTDRDYFRLLCRHMITLAEQGNVILIGRGSAYITQSLSNCRHFRLFASAAFKLRSIRRRTGLAEEEAEKLIARKQRQRDHFVRDFLDRDAKDPAAFHLLFNNDRNSSEKTAQTIADYVLGS